MLLPLLLALHLALLQLRSHISQFLRVLLLALEVLLIEGAQFAHELVVELLHLLVFLGSDCLLGFELAMQEGVGLLQLGDGSLQGVVFGFDLLVLLFEDSGLLGGSGEGLALRNCF